MSTNHGETLSHGQLHLWTAPTDDSGSTAAYVLERILSPDEQKAAWRFRQAKDWHLFVVAHALLRFALSQYFPVAVGDWSFARGRNQKPFIAGPNVSQPPPQFSLSHTDGLIVCLIASSTEIGVDAEKVEYNHDLSLAARRVLSAAELRTLSNLSKTDWTASFFDYWTLKEAYAKARGLGVGLKFSDISIEQAPPNLIHVHFASSVGDDPSAWMFWCRRLPSKHSIAVAARKDSDCDFQIIERSVKFDGMGMAVTLAQGE